MTASMVRAPPAVDAVEPASFTIKNRPSRLVSHMGDLDEPKLLEKYAPLKISLGCLGMKTGLVSTATATNDSPFR